MSTPQNAMRHARAAVTIGLMGLASMSPAIMATTALADTIGNYTYSTGQLTINNIQDNSTSFKAYRIFGAHKSSDGKAYDVAWASDEVKTAVLDVLNNDTHYVGGFQTWLTNNGHTDNDAATNAEYAAQYIAGLYYDTDDTLKSSYTQTDQSNGDGAIIDNSELLNAIAAAVDDTAESYTLTAGTATTVNEGYYVVTTDTNSINEQEAGTAPIFALVGTDSVIVTEKATIPTVDKTVASDVNNNYVKVADAQLEQVNHYKIVGTVANNVKTYSTYAYKFTDNLDAGLMPDMTTLHVYVGDGTVPTTYSASAFTNAGFTDVTVDQTKITKTHDTASGANTVTVNIPDLKSLGVTITADTKVIVTYDAKLDVSKADSVTYGGSGNANTVKITYSNNPNTDSKGDTHTDTVKEYSYKLKINKVDRDTGEDLQGAKFTIQATAPDDTTSTNKYVQSNGTLGDTAYEFETDADGIIQVKGLDAGTYTVHETQAPTYYQTTSDFTITIRPTYDADENLTTLAATTAGNNDVKNGIHDGDGLVTEAEAAAYIDSTTGEVKITLGDIRETAIPVTGAKGVFGIMLGGVVVGISLAAILRRNKKDNEDGTIAA